MVHITSLTYCNDFKSHNNHLSTICVS